MPPDVPSLCLLIHTDVTMAVPFNSSCLWLCIPEIVDDPSFFFRIKSFFVPRQHSTKAALPLLSVSGVVVKLAHLHFSNGKTWVLIPVKYSCFDS